MLAERAKSPGRKRTPSALAKDSAFATMTFWAAEVAAAEAAAAEAEAAEAEAGAAAEARTESRAARAEAEVVDEAEEAETTAHAAGTEARAYESCEDLNAQCPNWAEAGECQNNLQYMSESCRRSCGHC